MKLDREWVVTARVFAEAYVRMEAGEYGVTEFTRKNQRWVVVVEPNHIEAKKVPFCPQERHASRNT
jgi:hypothetical protein